MNNKKRDKERREMKDDIKAIVDNVGELKDGIGYKKTTMGIMGHYLKKPEVSIAEKVEAICKFLEINIIKTKPGIEVIKSLKKRVK